jgi:hypothetical protein
MFRRVRRRRATPLAAVLGLAMLAGGLAGCGPVTYVTEIGRASTALDEARAAQAERYAPYWWTRAAQYLHEARAVAAHADYEGARRFGKLAAEAATRATADARIAAGDPSKRPIDLAPDVAPARPTLAPVAPTRDLPAPGKDPGAPASAPAIAPAKDRPAPAPRPPARVAPAKDPP